MENSSTVNRIFILKAGMTPQDVINSKEATAQQKKMAYVFDSDGVAGYSQREADVFNATLITDRGQNGVSLWTRYKDGSKKETKYGGDISSFKFAPKGDVKPYVVTKKKATHATNKQNQVSQPQLSREEMIKKYCPESTLKGVGHLASVDIGMPIDTLYFHTKADSIGYEKVSRYAKALWNKAYNESKAEWNKAYNESKAEWNKADNESKAEWSKAYNKKQEATLKGDVEGAKKAQAEMSQAIRNGQAKKSQAIRNGEAKKSQAIKTGVQLRNEAISTFGITVHRYKPKNK